MDRVKTAYFFKKLRNVLLKKQEASSLTETIVATTIILIVFAIATLSLNNILENTIQRDTSEIESILDQYAYKYMHQKIKIPASYEHGDWFVKIDNDKAKTEEIHIVLIEATNKRTQQKVLKKIIGDEN